MVSRGDRVVVLYPTYFDASRSRAQGRRVGKDVALASPTLEEVREAARRAGYRVEAEEGSAHSSRPWKREGRVLIVGGGKKTEILHAVAREMKAQRS